MKKNYAALALFLFASTCIATAQNPPNPINTTRYLALGDSLAFGYIPNVPVNLNNYHGYPQFVSFVIHEQLANASCFGETSGSFLSATAPDLGCRAWKAAGNPLFISYQGTQMEYAINYLSNNPDPDFVTINIGGDDLGLLEENCASNADPLTCEEAGLPAVLAAYGQNLFTIFTNIRVQAKYKGPIVLLTYYPANFSYNDTQVVDAFIALNGIASQVATSFGASVADGFKAFQVATIPFNGDSCAAGLLVKLSNGTCDTHPSLLGQLVLAGTVLEAAASTHH
jgi:lysophospholipase L1-like esterase